MKKNEEVLINYLQNNMDILLTNIFKVYNYEGLECGEKNLCKVEVISKVCNPFTNEDFNIKRSWFLGSNINIAKMFYPKNMDDFLNKFERLDVTDLHLPEEKSSDDNMIYFDDGWSCYYDSNWDYECLEGIHYLECNLKNPIITHNDKEYHLALKVLEAREWFEDSYEMIDPANGMQMTSEGKGIYYKYEILLIANLKDIKHTFVNKDKRISNLPLPRRTESNKKLINSESLISFEKSLKETPDYLYPKEKYLKDMDNYFCEFENDKREREEQKELIKYTDEDFIRDVLDGDPSNYWNID